MSDRDTAGMETATPIETAPLTPWQENRRATEKRRKAEAIARRQKREEDQRLVLSAMAATGGASVREIGRQLGWSKDKVWRTYNAALREQKEEVIGAFRDRQLDRLDHLIRRNWRIAHGTDESMAVRASYVIARLISEQNKLRGAYPPVELDIGVGAGQGARTVSFASVAAKLSEARERFEAQKRDGVIDVASEVVDQPALTNGNTNGSVPSPEA